jgi:hypothetical protein
MMSSKPKQPRKKRISNEVKLEIYANRICAAVGQKLQNHYPRWIWFIECKWETGIVTVKNLSLHGDYGFVLHLEELVNDADLKLVVVAGGELLERCGFEAGPRPENISHKERDIKGNVKIDTQGA